MSDEQHAAGCRHPGPQPEERPQADRQLRQRDEDADRHGEAEEMAQEQVQRADPDGRDQLGLNARRAVGVEEVRVGELLQPGEAEREAEERPQGQQRPSGEGERARRRARRTAVAPAPPTRSACAASSTRARPCGSIRRGESVVPCQPSPDLHGAPSSRPYRNSTRGASRSPVMLTPSAGGSAWCRSAARRSKPSGMLSSPGAVPEVSVRPYCHTMLSSARVDDDDAVAVVVVRHDQPVGQLLGQRRLLEHAVPGEDVVLPDDGARAADGQDPPLRGRVVVGQEVEVRARPAGDRTDSSPSAGARSTPARPAGVYSVIHEPLISETRTSPLASGVSPLG